MLKRSSIEVFERVARHAIAADETIGKDAEASCVAILHELVDFYNGARPDAAEGQTPDEACPSCGSIGGAPVGWEDGGVVWMDKRGAYRAYRLSEHDPCWLAEQTAGREAKRKSRMWLFAAQACDRPIYVYEYNPTRSGKVAEDFLRGWSGWLVTDGYRPYFALDNGGEVRNVACLVHIRRKFAEIVKLAGGDAKAEGAGSVALAARRRIDAMFAADSRFDEMAAAGEWERRRLGRERDLRPLMEEFFIWAQAGRMEATPRMALDKALEYAVKYWPYAMGALDDGRLPLDNNLAERGIKPFVIGRKNFLFSDTPRGAEASAGMYSIVVTAKTNGLNPRKYVQWLLEEMPNAENPDDPAYLDSLMPWSESVPAEIRLKPKAAEEAARMADDPIIDIDPSAFRDDKE